MPFHVKESAESDHSAAAPVLEQATAEFAAATANPPFLFELGPAEGCKAVDEVQSEEIAKRPSRRCGSRSPGARPAPCR